MNWIKIKEECPKAFVEFAHGVLGVPEELSLTDNALMYDTGGIGEETFNNRDLYDHFDELKIRAGVCPVVKNKSIKFNAVFTNPNRGGAFQRLGGEMSHEFEDFHTRIEAESAMFEEVFRIREKQLNQ